jgi:MOSC domain-containing protein YiiM
VWLDTLNLAGDGQDDLDNHGGVYRAVLAYSAEHYPVWRDELHLPDLAYGSFGENFTVSGLTETDVYLGDVYAVGETRLRVAQPRMPCWKLARRVGVKDLAARVEARGWGGWYHQVLQTGYVQAGDRYELVERGHTGYPIAYIVDLMTERQTSAEAYRELATLDALTPEWRNYFAGKADAA